jgi:hypothetical protein
MDGGNVFSDSLATLGHWLLTNQGGAQSASGMPDARLSMATSSFTPPQGTAQAVPAQQTPLPVGGQQQQPSYSPQGRGGYAPQAGAGGTIDLGTYDPNAPVGAMDLSGYSGGGGQTVGDIAGGAGSGKPTSNAISGISSALSKGLQEAGSAIANVKTMPTPIQSGPFPSINQITPTLIGRRTQQPVF